MNTYIYIYMCVYGRFFGLFFPLFPIPHQLRGLEDRIQRYGGLTGPSLPWPLEEKKKSLRQDRVDLKPQHAVMSK